MSRPIPETLAGFQQVQVGCVEHGDLLVWGWPEDAEWAEADVGLPVSVVGRGEDVAVYRQIPCPTQGGLTEWNDDPCTGGGKWDYTVKYNSQPVRTFETGATRDTDDGKHDFEGFLSPIVLKEFAAYMHKHRVQSDGNLRDSCNWQRGIPQAQYMKSMLRHLMDLWLLHRGFPASDKDGRVISKTEALCAVMFNVQGYLLEELKK